MASTLPGTVQPAAPNLLGFDADTVITAQVASEFKNNGYSFCIRYLSLSNGQQYGDLSNSEAATILGAGLALSAVQHVPMPGWAPDPQLGTEYGTNAAANAASIGLPQGMNLWCDLEGIAAGTSAQNVAGYCNAWYNAVHAAGYIPGLYVGANCILDGNELYDLEFQHYWQSESMVPQIPYRGYQMVQHYVSEPVFGIGIDSDNTQTDAQGGTVIWLMP